MDWQQIVLKARNLKVDFDRSYKSLNTDRYTSDETISKHVGILVNSLENIRVLLNVHYSRLTTSHKAAAEAFYSDVRGKLIAVTSRKNFKIEIPYSIHENITFKQKIVVKNQSNGDKNKTQRETKMTQTVVEFLSTASRLIPDYDGRPDNLQSFIDALCLVDSIKESHEAVAINLVKTKLKGAARNLISNETTLLTVITKLKSSIKGETVDVVTAKLMNVRQQNKSANSYATEVDDLAKRLESAYISDGLSSDLANTYATKTAVKAIVKNATNEKVKLIMESGNFSNMNEVMAKFVNSCTESYGQPNSTFFYGSNHRGNIQYRKNYRGNRNGTFHNKQNTEHFQTNNTRFRGNGNNYRGRGRNSYRGNQRDNRNGRNQDIRVLSNNNSENAQAPLNVQ